MDDRKTWEAANPGGDYDQYKQDYQDKQQSDALTGMMGVEGTPPVDYAAMYDAMASMYEKMSKMNEDKFNRYWPESLTQGIKAGGIFDAAGRQQAGVSQAFNLQQADVMNNWLAGMTTAGNQYMRGEAGKMNQWTMGQVSDVNKFNSDEFYKALNTAMPGIMDTAADYKGTVDQMLSGQLPDAVKKEIAQAGAERGLSSGTYGPSLDNAQLRDLGINRLQYLQAGQAQMGNLVNIAGVLTAPVATPSILQGGDVMMTPQPHTPQPTYSTPSNIPGIAGNYLSAIMGGTMMQPAAGINAAVTMGGIQNQTNMANTQLQYSKQMSMLNYSQAQQNLAWNQDMFHQQQNMQQEQNWWNLIGAGVGGASKIGAAFAMPGL